jgi:hypothetical protein
MLLKDMLPAGWRAEIVATDLSLEVLEKAKARIYTQFEVQRGLPIQLLVKHFKQVGDVWQLNPDIRAMVRYQQANLLQDFSSRNFRHHLLPQRADLFRSADQDRCVRTDAEDQRAGRLSVPGSGGNRHRPHRRLPCVS